MSVVCNHRKLFKLTKVFAGGAGGETRELPLAVAEEGKAKVVAFQAYLPLIAAVCNPGLRERHWEALAELVGFQIKQDEVSCSCVHEQQGAQCISALHRCCRPNRWRL